MSLASLKLGGIAEGEVGEEGGRGEKGELEYIENIGVGYVGDV